MASQDAIFIGADMQSKKKLEQPADIRRAAMDLLARREHGVQELAQKLRLRGADENLLGAELQRLVDEGLLCEQRYVESHIRSRSASGRGPMRIREELTQRGLRKDLVSQALDEADEDWEQNLRELWQRKFGIAPADPKSYAKQARFLIYRGYAPAQVQKLLRSVAKDLED